MAIEDESALPAACKRHAIQIRLAPENSESVDALLAVIAQATAALPASGCEIRTSSSADKASIRAALQAGHPVTGARLEHRNTWSIQ